MHLAVGPLVRLFTRHLYREIEQRTSWYVPVQLSREAISELAFWLDNIVYFNGFTFKHSPTTSQIIVFTDAAGSGWGGFMLFRLEKLICNGKFSIFERQQSSTYRELLAVKLVFQSYSRLLANQSVQVNIDNFSASRILSVGSTKISLHNLAVDIFYHCIRYNIKLIPRWIPREQNTIADYYSKMTDSDDWTIDRASFNLINLVSGTLQLIVFQATRTTSFPFSIQGITSLERLVLTLSPWIGVTIIIGCVPQSP